MEGLRVALPDPLAQGQALVERIRREIPLTAAMQVGLAGCDGEALALSVPLGPNINDKGTAFAGSITALASIAGWCLLTLWSEREGIPCQVAIYDARFRFSKPLGGDFTARAVLPAVAERGALRDSLERRGKGRVALRVVLADAAGEAAFLEADYALWRS